MLWAIVVLGVIVVLLLLFVAWVLRKYSDMSRRYSDLSGRYDRDIVAARAESVKQSRAVHLGGIAEQIAPLLPGFPYDPKDCRWAGQPIDMIVFDELEGGGDITVVFLEIKTGKSQRKKNQRRVKTAIDARRVRFAEYRPDLQWASIAVEAPDSEPALSPGEGAAKLRPSQSRGKTPAQKRRGPYRIIPRTRSMTNPTGSRRPGAPLLATSRSRYQTKVGRLRSPTLWWRTTRRRDGNEHENWSRCQ